MKAEYAVGALGRDLLMINSFILELIIAGTWLLMQVLL